MNGFFNNFTSLIPVGLWSVIKAAAILILAFIIAAFIKKIILKLLDKINLEKKLSNEEADKTRGFVGNLVYLLAFLLFVPDIFSSLGMSSISAPITGLLNILLGYIPNILAASIILVVGFLVARLIRQLLIPVFNKIKVDKLQEKVGVDVPETARLSSTLAYIVYVLILIPVIITALNALNIEAISQPAIGTLNDIINFIPNIVVGLIIIIVGFMIGKFGGQIVERLVAASGLDAKLAAVLDGRMKDFLISRSVGIVVQVVITIFFVVEGINILNLQILTGAGAAIIGYMPNALAAVLILAGSILLSSVAARFLEKYSHTYAIIVKCAIMTIGSFMILSQLGIANTLVNAAFILMVGALAVAFAVAFGLGGRTFAGNVLKRLEEKTFNKNSEEK